MRDIDPEKVKEVFDALHILAQNKTLRDLAYDQRDNAEDAESKELFKKLVSGLEIAKYDRLIDVRSGPKGRTYMSALSVLTVGKMEIWIRNLLADHPDIMRRVIVGQGLSKWPYFSKVMPSFIQGLQPHQLAGFVIHPEVAKAIAIESVRAANTIAKLQADKSELRQKLLLHKLIDESATIDEIEELVRIYRQRLSDSRQLTTASIVPITDLGLHKQAEIALVAAGITTVADLLDLSWERLNSIPGIRARRLAQISTVLKEHGYPQLLQQ